MEKSKFVTEYEIKCTVADFKADFKKAERKFIEGRELTKHGAMANRLHGQEKPVSAQMARWRKEPIKYWTPNYFYFVCFQGVLPVADIPEHAGLIKLVFGKYRGQVEPDVRITKKAPILHKERLGEDDKLIQIFLRRLSNIAAYGSSYVPS